MNRICLNVLLLQGQRHLFLFVVLICQLCSLFPLVKLVCFSCYFLILLFLVRCPVVLLCVRVLSLAWTAAVGLRSGQRQAAANGARAGWGDGDGMFHAVRENNGLHRKQ